MVLAPAQNAPNRKRKFRDFVPDSVDDEANEEEEERMRKRMEKYISLSSGGEEEKENEVGKREGKE